jgi:hypothetical protein
MEKVKVFFGSFYEKENTADIINKRIIQLLWLLASIHVLVMLAATMNQSMWMDEAYTLTVLRDVPFVKMFHTVLAVDYQPPLYYFIGKAIMTAIMTLAPVVTDVTAAKIVSVIPCILLMVLSATRIRSRFGELTAAFFAFCMTAMPQIMHYGVEIRTYSWSMMCVTIAFVFAYDVIDRGKVTDWFLFTVTAIIAVYTHYFALMAVFFIYAFCALWFLINKKVTKFFTLIASGIVLLLAFMPCIITVFNGFTSIVSSDSWYEAIGVMRLGSFIFWPFDSLDRGPVVTLSSVFTWISLLSYIIIAFIPLFVFKKDKPLRKINNYFANSGFLVMFCVIALSCIIGWIFRPWFVIRYAFPAIGAFWLCFCIGIKNFPVKHIGIFIIIFSLVMSVGNVLGFARYEYQTNKSFKTFTNDFVPQINENDVMVISDLGHLRYCFNEVLPVYNILTYKIGDYSVTNSVFPEMKRIDSYSECVDYVMSDNQYIYIELTNGDPGFGSKNVEDEFFEWIESENIRPKLVGNYSFESYSFRIYRVSATDLINAY